MRSGSEGDREAPESVARQCFDAYLSVGGIPVYLRRLTASSVYQSLCQQSFRRNSFFADEFEKVFVSSFGNHPTYRQLVARLGQKGPATREQLADAVGLSSGGTLSRMLIDLEECGFIKRVVPLDKPLESLLSYYQIRDPYLHFYFRFIEPIRFGRSVRSSTKTLRSESI